jgi:CRISPR-associated protein Cas6
MLWEEQPTNSEIATPDDIVDLQFSIECRELPVDHAQDLCTALHAALPWLAGDDRVGVHQIHVAASQNGWERPLPGSGQLLVLSKRTKLTLRIPLDRLEAVQTLTGSCLDVGGYPMKIGASKTRPLSRLGTIFSRYVVSNVDDDEEVFLECMAAELASMQIRIKKALCGIPHRVEAHGGPLLTRSLLLADLKPDDSINLQRAGLGSHRKLGCGVFIPHKGIDPVRKPADDAAG